MTVELLIDLIGVRLNGPRAAQLDLEINLVVSDRDDDAWSFGVRQGVVHARHAEGNSQATVHISSTIAAFSEFASGSKSLEELLASEDFRVTGDVTSLNTLVDSLDVFEFGFEIVLP
jgi:alkyl sulfatase BDS1-like metallo-beta-lactamase superfamily hydrolase